MEAKCKVCGTINDVNNNFCKGCFLPLHKTMQEWTRDVEEKINNELAISKSIEKEDNNIQKENVEPKELVKEEKENNQSKAEVIESVNNDEKEQILNSLKTEKEIEDIKNDLESVSLIKDNNQKQDVKKEENAVILTLKFDLILFILSIAFTFVYGLQVNDMASILYGVLATVIFSTIAILLTFNNSLPTNSETNKMLFGIFTTLILFEIIFRCLLFYMSSISYLYIYVFISVVYILIAIMNVNIISNIIRKKKHQFEPSKYVSKLNLITLLLIILFIIAGVWLQKTQYQINTKQESNAVELVIPDELKVYIQTINTTIIDNIQNDENYQIPETITDPNFVETSIEIESVNLSIDEYGTVASGEIKYKGTVYRYKNQNFLVQE